MTSATQDLPASRQASPNGEYSHRQIMTILTGLLMGMFLAALDQTVVSTAIRTIGDDLHGLSIQAWVTTAFLITSTIATPLYGKLSDIYGRKPFFMLAITVFVVGSALCGLSTSMYMLAAFRALQGIGAGGLFSLALAIIGDIIPPRERAKYQGYFMAVFGTSSVLGPLIGGFLAGTSSILGLAGWRWIFWINVPLGIAALAVVYRSLQLDHTRRDAIIDYWGSVALVVGLVPLLIVAEQGREWGWGSPGALVCYVVGVIGLVLFVWDQKRMGDDALIPLRLFKSGPFSVGSSLSFVLGIGMFGGIMTIPLYLQLVKGASPTESGLLMLPLVLGIMSASMVSGQVTSRTGRYRLFPIVGTALMAAAALLLHFVSADSSLVVVDIYMFLFGAGLGLCMQTVVLAMQNSVPAKDMGVATSSATFFRQVGGTLGTAVFLSVLFSTLGNKVKANYAAAFNGGNAEFTKVLKDPTVMSDPKNAQFVAGLKNPASGGVNLNDTSFLNGLNHVLAQPFREGFASAMGIVFLVAAAVIALGFILSLLLKEVPLRTMSAQQAAAQEAAAAAPVTSESVDELVGVRSGRDQDGDQHTQPVADEVDPDPRR